MSRLANPRCIDGQGVPSATQPASAAEACATGKREFSPIQDAHFGVTTTSLGSHGGEVCAPTSGDTRHNDDQAQLIPSKRSAVASYRQRLPRIRRGGQSRAGGHQCGLPGLAGAGHDLEFLSGAGLASGQRWSLLVGDSGKKVPPADAFMTESIEPRSGQNPLLMSAALGASVGRSRSRWLDLPEAAQ